jgi:hypothetical protein
MRSPSGNISTPWAWFLEIAFSQEDAPSFLVETVKPARRLLPAKLKQLKDSGRNMIEAIEWIRAGNGLGPEIHAYTVPAEFNSLFTVLFHACEKRGLDDSFRFQLVDPFFVHEESYRDMIGKVPLNTIPKPITPADIIQGIVDAATNWHPGDLGGLYRGQSQKSNPEIAYVRTVAAMLNDACQRGDYGFPNPETLPYGRLLSHDDLARLARAALDMPDEPPGYPHRKPFDKEDVRKALKGFIG